MVKDPLIQFVVEDKDLYKRLDFFEKNDILLKLIIKIFQNTNKKGFTYGDIGTRYKKQ